MDWKEIGYMATVIPLILVGLVCGVCMAILLAAFGTEGLDDPHRGKRPL